MIRIVYFSENLVSFRSRLSHMRQIQVSSVANNSACGVTGALLHDDDWFVQLLEGPRADVYATYERILKDPRHANVCMVSDRPIGKRTFREWDMGFAERNKETKIHFGEHWFSKSMNPKDMTERSIITLMRKVTQHGLLK